MQQINILIIEKSQGFAEKINDILSENTDIYKTECSRYIETSILKLKENTFDLILLELNISNKNNEALFEKIYSNTNGVPIIVLIDIIDKKIVPFLMKRGFWDFLYKDKLTFENLSGAIRYNVEKNKKNHKLQFNEIIYQKIAEQSDNNLFVVNKEGIIKYANAAFARLFELSIHEIEGRYFEYTFDTGKKIEIQTVTRNQEIHFLEMSITNSNWENEEHFFVSIADITNNKKYEKWKILEAGISEIFESEHNAKNCISKTMHLLQEASDMESVAIRLKEGNNFKFFSSSGFSAEFIKNENHLCNCFMSGNFIYDSSGNPVPECMGKYYPFKDSYLFNFSISKNGSYWSNNLNERTYLNNFNRNKERIICKSRIEGYNSIALIHIRAGNKIIGILHLNDRRENMLSEIIIQYIENICNKIGTEIIHKFFQENLNIKIENDKPPKSSILHSIYKKLPQPISSIRNLFF